MDLEDIISGIIRMVVFMMAVMAYMLLFPIHLITVGKFLRKPMSSLRKFILHKVDPVCQDECVRMYCLYDGDQGRWISYNAVTGGFEFGDNAYRDDYERIVRFARFVRLAPCRDPNDTSRISSWEPDPKEIQRLGLARPSQGFAKPKEPSKSVFAAILFFCGRKLADSISPECRSPNEIRSDNDDALTMLVPVMDPDNPLRIDDWVPDPEYVGHLNQLLIKTYSGKWVTAPDNFESYMSVLFDDGENDDKSSVQKSKNGTCKPDAKPISKDSFIAIDGSNVICYGDEKCNGVRGTKVLSAVVNSLVRNGYQCKVFLDGSMIGRLKHKEHDEEGLKYLQDGEKKGRVVIAPGGAEADGQILQFADFEKNVHVITNDHYRDYEKMHPWLKDGNRLHGINVVPMGDARFRVLVAGFNLDITVRA